MDPIKGKIFQRVKERQTATGIRRLGAPAALLPATCGVGPGREGCRAIGSARGFDRAKENDRSFGAEGTIGSLDGCLYSKEVSLA